MQAECVLGHGKHKTQLATYSGVTITVVIIHTHAHTHIYVHTYVHMYIISTCAHIHTDVCRNKKHSSTAVIACTYIQYVYIHVYIYTNIIGNTRTNIHTYIHK